ncbi:Anti-sigma-E factor RseA [Ferriphaselus amnicola]|uniref:Anti-sigma-E factor RseA n=1 Tax=Ferriphaselus amnicola TaxID=1188319 RepID=A0A2Z6GDZ8_9PROT|nr:sigma-E factor negative regulatory protein [Ferriphaselus amnicola]BBE51504.1 Anti-sigma-E factor RseA [Ferriphaselus amnicola]
MKQQISALMDGELFDDDAETLLDVMKRHPEADEDWQTYHLIGDILRQPDQAHADISTVMRQRLQAEPTVLAPKARTRQQKARWFALSAAASVLAVGVVAWMSVQISPEVTPQLAAQQQEFNVRPASYSVEGGVNDYLMAHQEMSPSSDIQGAVPYARAAVSGQQGR